MHFDLGVELHLADLVVMVFWIGSVEDPTVSN